MAHSDANYLTKTSRRAKPTPDQPEQDVWTVVMWVPKPAQAKLGVTRFTRVIIEDDPVRAQELSLPIIAEFQGKIDQAMGAVETVVIINATLPYSLGGFGEFAGRLSALIQEYDPEFDPLEDLQRRIKNPR